MDQRIDDVIRLCCKIADQAEFKNTWKNIGKGMWITAAAAGAGALLLGPIGFAVGGAAGGLLSWWWTSGEFKSLPQILKELPHAEKQKLYNDVVVVLGNPTWTDGDQLFTFVVNNPRLQEKVAVALLNYIKKKI